ncbi:MAG: phosphate ABC transporter ATP-binding protein PstB [Alphaproteobacteria bacterium]
MDVHGLSLWYGSQQALKNINLPIIKSSVTALIGASGCGKSSLLRCLNRMNDQQTNAKFTGEVIYQGRNIYHPTTDPLELRKKIGMVFQKPTPFPFSILNNIIYPLRIDGIRDKKILLERAEKALRDAALWDEVKDKLQQPALRLSGGQQQRLCIARAIIRMPEILLMDEPCSALDPISTQKIETLIKELKEKHTLVMVTHNMQQALRISDYTAFISMGELVEYGATRKIFTAPNDKRLEAYITGKVG